MARKRSFAEIALEMYESVEHSKEKSKRLKSSTFWKHEFRVKKKTHQVVERIAHILKEQHLSVSVKSGEEFGKEKPDDWIILAIWPPIDEIPNQPHVPTPDTEWFNKIKTRQFESEREVEYYFILPILEELGYKDEDIRIGYPVTMFDGVHKTQKEADFVLFKGPSRERNDVLLVVEAKKFNKDINGDHIGQTKSYVHELFPAFYIITNGQKIIVFRFNGMIFQDERVLDFDRTTLDETWDDLYNYVSKEATMQRKDIMKKRMAEWQSTEQNIFSSKLPLR